MGTKTWNGTAGNDNKSATKSGYWPIRWWSPWKMYGHGGSDTLKGGEDNDTLYGGSNVWNDPDDAGDYLDGKGGNDRLYGEVGDDTLWGGSGNDYLDGGLNNDHLNGGSGADSLYGNSGNDYLAGGLNNDYLHGGWGDDTLRGDSGNDTMFGSRGNDTYYVDSLTDQVLEEAQYSDSLADIVFFDTPVAEYTLSENVENLTVTGGLAGSIFQALGNVSDNIIEIDANIEAYVFGDYGNDKLYGSSRNDTLDGGDGNDELFGNDGSDQLFGGNHSDILVGGRGSDNLLGGGGDDTLIGVGGTSGFQAEVDQLSGGVGADKFYLFNPETGANYTSGIAAHAIINGYDRFSGDLIYLESANIGDYFIRQEYAAGIGNSNVLDTVIYQNNDVIGYVEDYSGVVNFRYE